MRIAVCDLEGGGRERGLVAALVRAGGDVYLVDSNGPHKATALERSTKLPEDFELVILHRGNRDNWLAQNRPAALEVSYSGAGPPVVRAEEEHWIQRPINSARDALSVDEAKEIIHWARKKLDGETKLGLPRALRSRQSFTVLPALAVLCQGYLAVHGDPEKREPDLPPEEEGARELVRRAQEEMGWYHVDSEILDTRVREPESRRELQKEVRCPSWWLEPFGKADLSSDVQKELRGHEESAIRVCALVDTIKRQKRVRPNEVAECFLAIHEIFLKT